LAREVPASALSDPSALDDLRLAVQNADIYTDLIAGIVAEASRQDPQSPTGIGTTYDYGAHGLVRPDEMTTAEIHQMGMGRFQSQSKVG
jgi:hypothetical protein